MNNLVTSGIGNNCRPITSFNIENILWSFILKKIKQNSKRFTRTYIASRSWKFYISIEIIWANIL